MKLILETGYIKMYRKILSWEWYSDVPTTRLFIHLLLTVNLKDCRWHGEFIPAGSRVTSVSQLAKEAGLSQKQIRGSLDKLTRANTVAKQTTPNYSVISIVNWQQYQVGGQTKKILSEAEQRESRFSGKPSGEIRANNRANENMAENAYNSAILEHSGEAKGQTSWQTKGKQQGKRGANEGQQNKNIKEDKEERSARANALDERRAAEKKRPRYREVTMPDGEIVCEEIDDDA